MKETVKCGLVETKKKHRARVKKEMKDLMVENTQTKGETIGRNREKIIIIVTYYYPYYIRTIWI